MHSPRPLNQSTQCLFRPDGEHANFTEDPKTQTHEQTTHKPPHTPSPHSPYTPLTPPLPPAVCCVVRWWWPLWRPAPISRPSTTMGSLRSCSPHSMATTRREHTAGTHTTTGRRGGMIMRGGLLFPALEREGRGGGLFWGVGLLFARGRLSTCRGPR